MAIIIDMGEYHHAGGEKMSFHDYLLASPLFPDDFDELIERGKD